MGLVTLLAVGLDHIVSMGFMAAEALRNYSMLLMAGGAGHGGVKALVFLQLGSFILVAGEARAGYVLAQF